MKSLIIMLSLLITIPVCGQVEETLVRVGALMDFFSSTDSLSYKVEVATVAPNGTVQAEVSRFERLGGSVLNFSQNNLVLFNNKYSLIVDFEEKMMLLNRREEGDDIGLTSSSEISNALTLLRNKISRVAYKKKDNGLSEYTFFIKGEMVETISYSFNEKEDLLHEITLKVSQDEDYALVNKDAIMLKVKYSDVKYNISKLTYSFNYFLNTEKQPISLKRKFTEYELLKAHGL